MGYVDEMNRLMAGAPMSGGHDLLGMEMDAFA